MEKETAQTVLTYNRYWVTDNDGKKHLYLDALAAQMAEERYARELKESQKQL
jgi:hypothetical protein